MRALSVVRDACRPDGGAGEDSAQLLQRLVGDRRGGVEEYYRQGQDPAFVVAVRLEGGSVSEVEWIPWPEPEDTTVVE